MKTLATPIAVVTVVIGCLWFAAGCGRGKNPIDGQYQDAKSSLLTLEFDSGSCDISYAEMIKHCTYEISGNTITIRRTNDGATELTLTRQADGSLVDNGSGNRLVRIAK
jgi:hypothetical protein